MNTYSVQINGSGFHFPGADGRPLRGFTVTRRVTAASETAAVEVALAQVRDEWARGEFAGTGVRPVLSAASVRRLGCWARLTTREPGYHFHAGT